MTTNKNLLAAIRELIETVDGEQEWNAVVEKFPELQDVGAIKTMEEIVKTFEIDLTPDEIYQHWQARIEFLKKRQAPPE